MRCHARHIFTSVPRRWSEEASRAKLQDETALPLWRCLQLDWTILKLRHTAGMVSNHDTQKVDRNVMSIYIYIIIYITYIYLSISFHFTCNRNSSNVRFSIRHHFMAGLRASPCAKMVRPSSERRALGEFAFSVVECWADRLEMYPIWLL